MYISTQLEEPVNPDYFSFPSDYHCRVSGVSFNWLSACTHASLAYLLNGRIPFCDFAGTAIGFLFKK